MREIKFRAKTEQGRINGDWFYWSLLDMVGPNDIREDIIPETIGQFIGPKDKNGKEIYEGDIMQLYMRIRVDKIVKAKKLHIVEWEPEGDGDHYSFAGYSTNYFETSEVIGNIYENKELLTKK